MIRPEVQKKIDAFIGRREKIVDGFTAEEWRLILREIMQHDGVAYDPIAILSHGIDRAYPGFRKDYPELFQ